MLIQFSSITDSVFQEHIKGHSKKRSNNVVFLNEGVKKETFQTKSNNILTEKY